MSFANTQDSTAKKTFYDWDAFRKQQQAEQTYKEATKSNPVSATLMPKEDDNGIAGFEPVVNWMKGAGKTIWEEGDKLIDSVGEDLTRIIGAFSTNNYYSQGEAYKQLGTSIAKAASSIPPSFIENVAYWFGRGGTKVMQGLDALGLINDESAKEGIARAQESGEEVLKFSKSRKEVTEAWLPDTKGWKDSFFFKDLPATAASLFVFGASSAALGGGPLGAVLVGGLSTSQDMMTEAYIEKGKYDGDIDKVGLAGLAIGASEGLPFSKGYDNLFKKTFAKLGVKGLGSGSADTATKKIAQFLQAGFIEGSEEWTQETLQTLAQNFTAQELYDANRQLLDGVAKGGALGFVSAFLLAPIYRGMELKKQSEIEDVYLKHATKLNNNQRISTAGREANVRDRGALVLGENPQLIWRASEELLNKGMGETREALGRNIRENTQEGLLGNSLKVANSFGTANADFAMGGLSEQATTAATKALENNMASDVAKAYETIQEIPNPNILDFTLNLGRQRFNSYVEGLQQSTPAFTLAKNQTAAPLVLNETQKMSVKELHDINEEALADITLQTMRDGLLDKVQLSDEFQTQLTKQGVDVNELKTDIITAGALDFGSTGINMLRLKWQEKISAPALDHVVANVKTIASTLNSVQKKKYNVLLKDSYTKASRGIVLARKTAELEAAYPDGQKVDMREVAETEERLSDTTSVSSIASFKDEEEQLFGIEKEDTPEELNLLLQESDDTQNKVFTTTEEVLGERPESFQGTLETLKKQGALNEDTEILLRSIFPFVSDTDIIWSTPEVNGIKQKAQWTIDQNTGKPEIWISPVAQWKSKEQLGEAFLHEAIHAYTAPFLRLAKGQKGYTGDNPNATLFYGQVESLLNELNKALDNPSNTTYQKTAYLTSWTADQLKRFRTERDAFNKQSKVNPYTNVYEFYAYAMQGNNNMREALLGLFSGEDVKLKHTGFRRLVEFIANLVSKIRGIKNHKNAYDALVKLLETFAPEINLVHLDRMGKIDEESRRELLYESQLFKYNQDESGFTTNAESVLDYGQEDGLDEESALEYSSVQGFGALLATIDNRDIYNYYEFIKNFDLITLEKYVEDLNEKSGKLVDKKLKEIYSRQFKKYGLPFEEWKTQFFIRKLTYAANQERQTFANIDIMQEMGFNEWGGTSPQYRGLEVKNLPTTFVTPNGTKSNVFQPTRIAKDIVAPLSQLLGTDVEIVNLNAFNLLIEGNATESFSMNRLSDSHFSKRKASPSEEFAKGIENVSIPGQPEAGYIYLGNFGGKNTTFIIKVNNRAIADQKIKEIEKRYETLLDPKLREASGQNGRSQVVRALIQDIWSNQQFDEQGLPTTTSVGKDINKVFKRGGIFITPVDNPKIKFTDIQKHLGNDNLIGIEVKNNQLHTRGIIIDNQTQGGTIEWRGKTYNIQDILRNYTSQQTPTSDGATYYIKGHFDKTYKFTHGVFKQGVIKNVVASRVGEKPLYMKHAMHAVSIDSPLGQLMAKHNLAFLTTVDAVKIGAGTSYKVVDINQLQDGQVDGDNLIELPIYHFTRIKEEHNTDRNKGPLKQALSSTGIVNANPAIKENDPKRIIESGFLNPVDKAIDKITDYYKADNLLPEMLGAFKKIVTNPTSTKERYIASTFSRMVNNAKDDAELLYNLEPFFGYGFVKEAISSRISSTLTDAFEYKIGGYRGALRPSIGILDAPAQVDPITNESNLAVLFLNTVPTSTTLWDEVLKPGFSGIAKQYLKLQKQQTYYSAVHDKEKVEAVKKQIEDLRAEHNFTSILSFVDKTSTKYQEWMQKKVDEIIDPKSGRIKNGWIIITQDDANKFGVKVGDRVMLNVTPMASARDLSVQRIAAILPVGTNAPTENNVIIANSEYIQTVVGKDYDIDTAAIIPFDPEYWEEEKYESLLDKLEEVQDKYAKHTLEAVRKVLGDYVRIGEGTAPIKLDEDNVLSEEVRTQYATRLLGSDPKGKAAFSMFGKDFHTLNDAYFFEPGVLFSWGGLRTMMSALEFKTKPFEVIGQNRKTIQLDVNDNAKWDRAQALELTMRNDFVDFPNKTSKLYYNSDITRDPLTKAKLFALFFGLSYQDVMDLEGEKGSQYAILSLHKTMNLLFKNAFELSRVRNPITRGGLNYTDFIVLLEDQKAILEALINQDYAALDTRVEAKFKKNEKLVNNAKTFIRAFDFGNTPQERRDRFNRFPLFKLILGLGQLPKIGTTINEHMTHQALAVRDMLERDGIASDPALFPTYDRIRKEVGDASSNSPLKTFFIDTTTGGPFPRVDRGGEQVAVDALAIALNLLPGKYYEYTRRDTGDQRPFANHLDIVRREAISLIHTQGEYKGESKSEEVERNRAARRATYPLLFDLLLKQPAIVFVDNKPQVAVFDAPNGRKIEFRANKASDITINFAGSTEAYTHRSVATATEGTAKELKDILTASNGIWDSDKNRITLGGFLDLQRNIPVEERRDLAETYLRTNLYGKFTSNEIRAFWLSALVVPGKEVIDQRKVTTFIANQNANIEASEYTYPTVLPVLDLLATFKEYGILDSYMENYRNRFYQYGYDNIRNQLKSPALTEARRLGFDPSKIAFSYQELDNPVAAEIQGFDDLHTNMKMMLSHLKPSWLGKSFQHLPSVNDFSKYIKKNGYQLGYEKLKDYIVDLTAIRGIASLGYELSEVFDDIRTMSPEQFNKAYKSADYAELLRTYSFLADEGVRFLEDDMSSRGNDYRQLEALYAIVKNHYEMETKHKKELKGLRSFYSHLPSYKWHAYRYQKAVYSFANLDNAIDVAFRRNDDKLSNLHAYVRPLTVREIMVYRRQYPTRDTHLPVGDSSVALAKAQEINTALSGISAEMNSYLDSGSRYAEYLSDEDLFDGYLSTLRDGVLKDIEETKFLEKVKNEIYDEKRKTLGSLSSYKQDLGTIKEKIFLWAENLNARTGISLIQTINGLEYIKDGRSYKSPYELIENEEIIINRNGKPKKLQGREKLVMLAALNYRRFYDVEVPNLLRPAYDYLKNTFEQVNALGDKALAKEVHSLMQRYAEMLKSMLSRYGNYMPHQFPINDYKINWKSMARKVERESLYKAFKSAEKGKANSRFLVFNPGTEAGKEAINQEIERIVEGKWNRLTVDTSANYIIPNFLHRQLPDNLRGYRTRTDEPHHDYIEELVSGIKTDLLKADFNNYLAKARAHGESYHIIQLTKEWYGDQIKSKDLHTRPIKLEKVSRGMQIQFLATSKGLEDYGWNSISVWGIVDEMVKDKNGKIKGIQLHVNVKEEENAIALKLDRYYKMRDKLEKTGGEKYQPYASLIGQATFLANKKLVEPITRGEIDGISALALVNKIIAGLDKAKSNPKALGYYPISDVFTHDLGGNKTSNVNRYIKRGSVERLQAKVRELSNRQLMDGQWSQTMDFVQYNMFRLNRWGYEGSMNILGKTMGAAYLGMAQSMPAAVNNFMGGYINRRISFGLFNKQVHKWLQDGAGIHKRIHKNPRIALTERERMFADVISSLGLAETRVKITLDQIGVGADETADRIEYKALWKAFKQASGQNEYNKLLDKYTLERDVAEGEGKQEEADKLTKLILRVKAAWRAKINGYQIDLTNLSSKEFDDIIGKLYKKEQDLGLDTDMATELGYSRHKLAAVALKKLTSDVYRASLYMQSLPEALRRQSFFIGYYQAKDVGYDDFSAIQLGINYIGVVEAYYGPSDWQMARGTKAGKFWTLLSQFKFNSLHQWGLLLKEAAQQRRRYMPRGFNPIPKIKFLLEKDIKEVSREWQVRNKEGELITQKFKELNLNRIIFNRLAWGGLMMQFASVMYQGRGLGNWQDPVAKALYDLYILLLQLSKEVLTGEDVVDLGRTLRQFMQQDLFFLGAPALNLLAIPFLEEDETIVRNILLSGRPGRQLDVLTMGASSFSEDRMQERGKKRDLGEPTYILDTYLLGFPFFSGSSMRNEDVTLRGEDIFGEYDYKIKKADRYIETTTGKMRPIEQINLLMKPWYAIPGMDVVAPIKLTP